MCTRDGPAAAICPASPAVLSQLPARAAPLESTRSIVVPVEPTRLTPPSAKAGKPVPWASETPPGPLPRTASKTQGTSSATGAGDGAGGGAMCGQCVVAERQSEMLPVPPARPSWAPALHSRALPPAWSGLPCVRSCASVVVQGGLSLAGGTALRDSLWWLLPPGFHGRPSGGGDSLHPASISVMVLPEGGARSPPCMRLLILLLHSQAVRPPGRPAVRGGECGCWAAAAFGV